MNKKMMKPIKNEKGLASIEATILIVLFISLLYFTYGFFGIVHTAILHNVHARTYAFETFRHRTNLTYFRSNRPSPGRYHELGTRLHGINTDTTSVADTQIATERPISMGLALEEQGRRPSVHMNDVFQRVPASGRNTSVEVNPVWIRVIYGICLNSSCGEG